MTTAIDWSFLAPWRDVLRALLEYVDGDELTLGTMDSGFESLQLHLENAHSRLEKARGFYPEDENLMAIREALELVGLVLHYDKRAWKELLHPVTWDRDLVREPFGFDSIIHELEPLFKITLYDATDTGPDCWYTFENFHELFTSTETPSTTFFEAFERIESLVGAAWDPAYRIPLWLVLVPEWGEHDAPTWVTRTREVMQTLQDPTSDLGSVFQLEAMTIVLLRAPLQTWILNLMDEARVTNVALKQFGLPLSHAHRVTRGLAVNAATGFGQFYHNHRPRIKSLAVNAFTMSAVVALCTSVARASFLEKLELWDALPGDGVERALCWRWLGYALTNGYHASSVHDLTIESSVLRVTDVENFTDTSTVRSSGSQSIPPTSTKLSLLRYVRLDSNASIWVGSSGWQTLQDLRFDEHDGFTVLSDGMEEGETTESAATVRVLVPGFGVCLAKCQDVVDAGTLTRSEKRHCPLDTVDLDLSSREAPALPLFLGAVGARLVRLSVVVREPLTLTESQATAMLEACPQLAFLHLGSVSVGSMSVFTRAYDNDECRIRVLSLLDSYVDARSMTHFARELMDPRSRVASRLEEFRYVYEVRDLATGKCPEIIDDTGVVAFQHVLQSTSSLAMLDIGLSRRLYSKYQRVLKSYHRTLAREQWTRSKTAFLSAVATRATTSKKKSRRRWRPWLPNTDRRDLATTILRFARPRLDRLVSVIYVPRRRTHSEHEPDEAYEEIEFT